MELVIATLSGFGLAALAPWLYRLAGERVAFLLALLPLAITVYFGCAVLAGTDWPVTAEYAWVPSLDLQLSFYWDGLSQVFVLAIAGVGALVVLYSRGYMSGQAEVGVFYAYLLSFMAAMLGVVLAGNVLTLYVFWELTTLFSFLLIGFEHERASARRAAVQSLLTTALGGLAMLAGLVLLGIAAGSFEFSELLTRGEQVREHTLYPVILTLILIGAFTKSAQFPFHYWLPNAMQAPTPVSAYLHSATMVKAGVYLLARLYPVLGGTPEWTAAVTVVGAITMFLGAWLAYFQHELKRILAYLTVNVLGTLVMLLGLGTPLAVKAVLTYLVAHTLYKGSLFMMAGAVGHETRVMDVRRLGGLWRRMPLTALTAVLGGLSMAGVAPMLGFIAKELYLESVWDGASTPFLLTSLAVAASALVAAGAGIVAIKPFFAKAQQPMNEVHEVGFWLVLSPLLLATAGVVAGIWPGPLVSPLIEPALQAVTLEPARGELMLWHGVNAPLLFSITALLVGAMIYAVRRPILRRLPDARLITRWGPERGYEQSLRLLQWLAERQSKFLQNGYLRRYVLTILAVTVALIALMLPRVWESMVWPSSINLRFHEGVAAALILAAAWMTISSSNRYRAIASLGVVGMSVAWIFALFGGPDLAMTQIVVETLTVLLFVVAFRGLPNFRTASTTGMRIRDALVAVTVGGVVTMLMLLVTGIDGDASISDYYAEDSYRKAHGRNVVNVILVDFRALDTMGEVTVLATAAMGVHALIRLVVRRSCRT